LDNSWKRQYTNDNNKRARPKFDKVNEELLLLPKIDEILCDEPKVDHEQKLPPFYTELATLPGFAKDNIMGHSYDRMNTQEEGNREKLRMAKYEESKQEIRQIMRMNIERKRREREKQSQINEFSFMYKPTCFTSGRRGETFRV